MAGFVAGFLVGAVFAFAVCGLLANDWHWRD